MHFPMKVLAKIEYVYVLNDVTSALFQVGLGHSHICSQGHKFTDREISRAARLLRLHCYCM